MESSPYLSCTQLVKRYGAQELFANLSFSVHPGERWGVVGPNGAGKSTLFRILSGEASADAGNVSVRKGLRVRIVAQKMDADPAWTVDRLLRYALPSAYRQDERARLLENELHAHTALAERDAAVVSDPAWIDKLTRLNDGLAQLGGADADNILESALSAGKLTELRERSLSALSGGQQKRVQIVAALLSDPQLLLLDEPTNHLDVETVEWLEEFLLEFAERGTGLVGLRPELGSEAPAFVVVSHDRALLDTLVNEILEIDRGVARVTQGNYESYLRQRLAREAAEASQLSRQANLMRRELAWLRAGTKARTTKQTARIERAEALDRQLEKNTVRSRARADADLAFDASMQALERGEDDSLALVARTLGDQELLRFEDVDLAVGAGLVVAKGLGFAVKPRMRVAFVGPNGCGKSSLIRLARGDASPQGGKIVRHELLDIAYFDQHRSELDPALSVRQTVCPKGDFVPFRGKPMHVMGYLERFLFSKYDAPRLAGDLSGGEQARLLLARLLLQEANLLLLDEPTNDLDIQTLQVLERGLAEYQGGILFTSHDRYFLRKVATHFLVYRAPRRVGEAPSWILVPELDQALGDDAADERGPPLPDTAKAISASNDERQQRRQDKQSQARLQREIAAVEAAIASSEATIARLEAELEGLFAGGAKFEETRAAGEALTKERSALEAHMGRWEELFARL